MTDEKIHEHLVNSARKVCTPGCIAGFECGKSKEYKGSLPLCGTNKICPLQKYEIKHDDRPQDLLTRLSNEPSLQELDLLCEFCEHRDKTADTDKEFSLESCFVSHCIDCPVESCREGIMEVYAEAQMS